MCFGYFIKTCSLAASWLGDPEAVVTFFTFCSLFVLVGLSTEDIHALFFRKIFIPCQQRSAILDPVDLHTEQEGLFEGSRPGRGLLCSHSSFSRESL